MVNWPAAAWSNGGVGANEASPDLTAICQEILDRPGWQPGNSMAFVFEGTGTRSAYSYDDSPGDAAVLYINVSGPTGLGNEIEAFTFSLFPNPTSETLNVVLPDDMSNATIELFDMTGKIVLSERGVGGRNTFTINQNWSKGNYLVRVRAGASFVTRKLIIQ